MIRITCSLSYPKTTNVQLDQTFSHLAATCYVVGPCDLTIIADKWYLGRSGSRCCGPWLRRHNCRRHKRDRALRRYRVRHPSGPPAHRRSQRYFITIITVGSCNFMHLWPPPWTYLTPPAGNHIAVHTKWNLPNSALEQDSVFTFVTLPPLSTGDSIDFRVVYDDRRLLVEWKGAVVLPYIEILKMR